jgi:hypothetical protein
MVSGHKLKYDIYVVELYVNGFVKIGMVIVRVSGRDGIFVDERRAVIKQIPSFEF